MAHNVNGWRSKRYNLFNCYKEEDPDIILISEHGMKDSELIKIYGYDVIQNNPSQGRSDGAAIAIKRKIKYRRGKTLEEAFLSIIVETTAGDIEIATGYQPPRRNYLPVHSLINLFNKQHPVLLIGDLNARTAVSGYRVFNGIGRSLNTLIDRGILRRIGPNFPTFYTATTATKPDIVIAT